VVISYPYTNYNKGWTFEKFSFNDPSGSFYLKLTEAETVDGWAKVSGKVRVQVNEPVFGLQTGDYIQVCCWLSGFDGATNPGQFNLKEYLASRNVYVGASVNTGDGIKVLDKGGGSFLLATRNYLYNYSNQALFSQAEQDNETGLLRALLLGYRGSIDDETYEAFRKTGLLHFISLSGMHLGILVGLVWWLCGRFGLLKPARAVVCIIVIILFLLIVPPREPTLRAAIICFVFCASAFFRRYPNPLNSLSLAAIILLLIRPTCLFEAGWQLSFASVLGILLLANSIISFLNVRIIEPLSKIIKVSFLRGFILFIVKYNLGIFAVGFAAWLGGSGILLYHFYTVNPLTCFWTVLAFPFIALILCLGYLKIVLALFFPTISAILMFLLNDLAGMLIWMVKLISKKCPSEILIGKVPLSYVLFFYAAILITGWLVFSRIKMKKLVMGFLITSVVVSLGFIKGGKVGHSEFVMTVLDVGHGQSIVLQGGGKNILFDAGSLHSKNIGQRVIIPFLRYSGISRLDAVVISHQDVDHINGLPEIAQQYPIGKVYASGDFLINQKIGMAGFLTKVLNKTGFEINAINDEILNKPFEFEILWPAESVCGDESLSDNDKSIVALITFSGKKILICSDIERFAQEEVLRKYKDLKADIVIAPHHGSAGGFESGFIEKLDAEYLICSCGQRRIEKLQNENITSRLFITARDGAVFVKINSTGGLFISGCISQNLLEFE
ncbi:MAG: DNA internalization-related competence protein ComEC/Rec2, partial [Sedimentisphaerales bacterium]|nr:DNA internalization-related competence protein ComEC/Rec2 [Sedimentisphaerales bacterium]